MRECAKCDLANRIQRERMSEKKKVHRKHSCRHQASAPNLINSNITIKYASKSAGKRVIKLLIASNCLRVNLTQKFSCRKRTTETNITNLWRGTGNTEIVHHFIDNQMQSIQQIVHNSEIANKFPLIQKFRKISTEFTEVCCLHHSHESAVHRDTHCILWCTLIAKRCCIKMIAVTKHISERYVCHFPLLFTTVR